MRFRSQPVSSRCVFPFRTHSASVHTIRTRHRSTTLSRITRNRKTLRHVTRLRVSSLNPRIRGRKIRQDQASSIPHIDRRRVANLISGRRLLRFATTPGRNGHRRLRSQECEEIISTLLLLTRGRAILAQGKTTHVLETRATCDLATVRPVMASPIMRNRDPRNHGWGSRNMLLRGIWAHGSTSIKGCQCRSRNGCCAATQVSTDCRRAISRGLSSSCIR